MRVPALPPRGGDTLATSCEVTAGGGFNVMAAAARQGLPVTLRRRARHGPVGRPGPRGACRGRHRPAPPARPGPRHRLRRRAGRTRRRAHVRHAPRRGSGARARGLGRGAGRPGRRGLRLRLRPGPAGLRPCPRRLGGRAAAWCPAVRRPWPAGGADPGRGARSRALPLRLAELQPPGGRGTRQHGAQRHWYCGRGRRPGPADAPGDPAELARRLLARGAAANILVRDGAAGCYVALFGSSTPSTCGRRR